MHEVQRQLGHGDGSTVSSPTPRRPALSDGTPDLSIMGALLLFLPHLVTCYEISQVSAIHSVIVWGS